jgi:adenylate cyclase
MKLEAQLRLFSGLIVAAFVIVHLGNAALGIFSIGVMDSVRTVLSQSWRSLPGTILLYGALLVHFGLALLALSRRSTLRMPWWEAIRIGLGLAIPPLLIAHAMDARLGWEIAGLTVKYLSVIAYLWQDPYLVARQILLVLVVWLHVCMGLHYWLRLKSWYRPLSPMLLGVAVVLPVLAILGFVDAGLGIVTVVERVGGLAVLFPDRAALEPQVHAFIDITIERIFYGYWLILAAVLALRWLKISRRAGRTYQIHHANGQTLSVPVGRTVLEAVRSARIPHASICGGRARCTTCRIRIGEGLEDLDPPTRIEVEALTRINADPNVRLACQTRPRSAVAITPLVAAGAEVSAPPPGAAERTREQQVVALFVDLRGSTALAETRLPFDVVFVLNQFFAGLAEALRRTDGHYSQFMGDGLLALYGLNQDPVTASRQALAGAALMQQELDALNERLAGELAEPLRMGIGVHLGMAIVGSMGPPNEPIISAIGDDVNVASRLEQRSKDFACTLVVSRQTVETAGLSFDGIRHEELAVRGRGHTIDAYLVDNPLEMPGVGDLLASIVEVRK